MRIKVKKEELKDAISIAKRALSKVVLQEERAHLLFTPKDSTLTVSSTNNDLRASSTISLIEYQDGDFSFTADPKALEKLLVKIEHEDIVLELDHKDLVLKVYTSEDSESFTSLQSFPSNKMLRFENITPIAVYQIDREFLAYTLKWSINYLSAMTEESKKYDFLVLNDNMAYSANGMNKMGYLACKMFKEFKNVKIRKMAIPILHGILDVMKDEIISFIETDKYYAVESQDKGIFFGFLKSSIETPKIKTDLIKADGKHIEIEKNKMLKALDRLVSTSKDLAGTGVQVTLSGLGDSSRLELSLIGNLKCMEKLIVSKVADDNDEAVSHIVGYKLFKSIMSSLDTEGTVKLFINDDAPFFKVYKTGVFKDQKYLVVGVGSYSRVVKQ